MKRIISFCCNPFALLNEVTLPSAIVLRFRKCLGERPYLFRKGIKDPRLAGKTEVKAGTRKTIKNLPTV